MRINVTKPFFPPIEEYQNYLQEIWDNSWLTNRGPLIKRLEDKLSSRMGLKYLVCTTNGTLPIQIAIKALELKGEIITTPFSYVATTSSICWEGCTPVFVDIDDSLTIDPALIEEKITESTSAILATHVFGNPCDVVAIDAIAKKYDLKVIYDAAHCFDVEYKGQSILNYGDVSTVSFHATKLFHTGEGGCWVTSDRELHDKLYYHHNFGHFGKENFHGIGINAKMSELQAAMGLAVLTHIDSIKSERQRCVEYYSKNLSNKVGVLELRKETKPNYHYYPVIFSDEATLLRVQKVLADQLIYPRRYFYPSLDNLPYTTNDGSCPVSNDISSRIMCLPLYHDLGTKDQERIVGFINKSL